MRQKPEPPADLWAEMDELHKQHGFYNLIAKPPGSFTSDEYAKRYGIKKTSANVRLKALISSGELEIVGIGLNRTPFYRIKQ